MPTPQRRYRVFATCNIGDDALNGSRPAQPHSCYDVAVNKEDVIKEAVGIIRRYLPRAEFEILLFGSWARGDAQDTSDIDIGLMGPEAVDDIFLLRIKEEIKSIPTLRRIDVVDLIKSGEEFRREVLSYARVL